MKSSSDPALDRASSGSAPAGEAGVALSIVVPTYNERENLPVLISSLQEIMEGCSFEIIVVDDDSEDGTWQVAEQFALDHSNISLVRRINRKGLSSAIIEGFLLGKGACLAVLDADLQHDARLLRRMLDAIPECDVVIGSRYLAQKSVPGWDSRRSRLSRAGTVMARKLLRKDVTDPLSGFFMLRRQIIHDVAPELFSDGYKILLDILIKRPELRVRELPYEFKPRMHGASKLTAAVALDFADLLISRALPTRINFQFFRYAASGAFAAASYFLTLYLLHVSTGRSFPAALFFAVAAAAAADYGWESLWSPGDHRFPGAKWWRKFGRHSLKHAAGILCNVVLGWYLFDRGVPWFPAGALGIWFAMSLNGVTDRFAGRGK